MACLIAGEHSTVGLDLAPIVAAPDVVWSLAIRESQLVHGILGVGIRSDV